MENHEIISNDPKIFIPLTVKAVSFEETNDFSIPEYMPEAKRILHITSEAIQPATYINSATAEFDGKIECNVFYVGSDDEIYTAPITIDYGIGVPIEELQVNDPDMIIKAFADVFSDEINAKLTGPRKINVKCKARAHSRIYCVCKSSALSPLLKDSDNTEILKGSTPSAASYHLTCESINFSEEIIPENVNLRVIGTDAKVFIHNVNAINNNAEVNGEIFIKLFTYDDITSKITTSERRIPINADIDLSEPVHGNKCSAYGTINNLTVNVLDDKIICDLSVSFTVASVNDESFSYVEDVYSTKYECEPTIKSYSILQGGYCLNGNFSMNEKVAKESIRIPENASIICAFGKANIDNVTCSNSKNIICAQVKYTLILESDGEYSSTDIFLPAKYEFITDENVENCVANISVVSCKARLDAQSVSIDAELCVYALGNKYGEIKAVSNVSFGNNIVKNKGDIIIHYIASDDTPWSIAKKHHVSIDELTKKNAKLESCEYAII